MKKIIRKAFKFRLKVTPEISQKLGRFAGVALSGTSLCR
jgi:hypothetical protein